MAPLHVSLALPSPLGTQHLSIPSPASTSLASLLPAHLSSCYVRTRTAIPLPSTSLSSLLADGQNTLDLQVLPRLVGGKGGFGAMLRATGGRMSSQKASNNDSCRDLTGRRLSSIKEAKKMADILDAQKDYKKLKSQAAKAKLESLERALGISAGDAAVALEALEEDKQEGGSDSGGDGGEETAGAGPSRSTSPPDSKSKQPPKAKDLTKEDLQQLAGKKHKFDDAEYLEQSREINESVRGAVAAGLLKKRKKAKLAASSAAPVAAV